MSLQVQPTQVAVPLPAIIEHTASQVFASFSERLQAKLNGRQERALKLALGGHVTHKVERIFSVLSESGAHTYLIDLDRGFCSCPDSQKGQVCKHRIAAYLVEQACKATEDSQQHETNEALERARQVLKSHSELLHEAIVYAVVHHDGNPLRVEVLSIENEVAFVRALPILQDGNLIPHFPFEGRRANAQLLTKSLTDITIFR